MQGYGRTAGRLRSRYLYYSLALLQTLVLAGYFSPWHQGSDGLLIEMHSDLTQDSLEHVVMFYALLVACFIVTGILLALALYVIESEGREIPVLRVTSLLTSFAIAGPLIYVQSLLGFEPGWSDLRDALGEFGVGLCLALLFGAGALLLALYTFMQARSSSGRGPIPVDESSRGTREGTYSAILMILFVSGVFVAVIGYFQTWSSGASVSVYGTSAFTRSGIDETPLMCLVPCAAVLASALLLLGQLAWEATRPAILLAAQSALVMGLALTVFWGLAIGEYELDAIGAGFRATLQPGWYVCLAGQLLALVCFVLIERFQKRRTP